MKNKDIKWNQVSIIEDYGPNLKKIEIDKNQFTIFIKYETLTYNDGITNWYMLRASLPYVFKTAWKKTEINQDTSFDVFKTALFSNLQQKYKDITTRDFNNRLFLKTVQEKFGNEISISELFNKPLHYQLSNGKYCGDVYYHVEEECKSTYLKKTPTSEDYKNNDIDTLKLSYPKFVKMMIEDKCYYCGINMCQISQLNSKNFIFTKRARGTSMEIDQSNAWDFYTDTNCVAACYWCNNAKSDEFYEYEFKIIAKSMKEIWRDRLAKISASRISCQLPILP